jgi:T4-like virus Myoviridae tail sheath stabiliser
MAQHFYDGIIRRYITQTIRVFSNFVVKYSDGALVRVPVRYGDADRQVAGIIQQNSENTILSVPRIAVYVTGLKLDKERLGDSTYVGKLHFRERDIDQTTNKYTTSQGRNYTVERIMPTPFTLSLKVDIWSANTDQKLQILEQILVLFNPSLEIQTTDNYIDWTSLTVLNLSDINWTSRTVPTGAESPIEVATLTLDTPIWLSPPAKVKHLGVITNIITSLYNAASESPHGYIEGLGIDLASPTTTLSGILTQDNICIGDYNIAVHDSKAILLGKAENVLPIGVTLDIPERQGPPVQWQELLTQYPGRFVAGSSRMFLIQPNGSAIVGTVSVDTVDPSILNINWDPDTLTTNTGIDSTGKLETDIGYNAAASNRPNSPGTIDAIVDPLTYNPKRPNNELTDQAIPVGRRFLIIEDIGSHLNQAGPLAWQSPNGVDLYAKANDIIEYTHIGWVVIFNSAQEHDTMLWQTNIYTGVQYLWNGISWVKSFEGVYHVGNWRLEL